MVALEGWNLGNLSRWIEVINSGQKYHALMTVVWKKNDFRVTNIKKYISSKTDLNSHQRALIKCAFQVFQKLRQNNEYLVIKKLFWFQAH